MLKNVGPSHKNEEITTFEWILTKLAQNCLCIQQNYSKIMFNITSLGKKKFVKMILT